MLALPAGLFFVVNFHMDFLTTELSETADFSFIRHYNGSELRHAVDGG